MVNYCSNAFSNLQHTIHENYVSAYEWCEEFPTNHPNEFSYIKSFPIAMGSTVAAGYLFNCASPSTSLIFGTINHICTGALMFLVDKIRDRENHPFSSESFLKKAIAIGVIALSGKISFDLMSVVLKTQMTLNAVFALSSANGAAQWIFSSED